MNTKRREDWQTRLHGCVETARVIPFEYGLHDCCLWAAHCIDAMCDTQFARRVKERFNYSSEDSAQAVILAGGGLAKLITEFLGEPVRGVMAAPGDVVLARQDDDQPIVGVVVGHRVVAPGPHGIATLSMGRAVLCWRV